MEGMACRHAFSFLTSKRRTGTTLKVKNSVQKLWRRKEASIEASGEQLAKRKTLALPSILTPYRTPSNSLPKPTPVNLRRFAETPLVRRAINVLKDRIASLDWQIRLKRGYSASDVADVQEKLQALRRGLEEPNASDSFRTLIEQALEDALVGGFGTIEMELTGDAQKTIRPMGCGWRDDRDEP